MAKDNFNENDISSLPLLRCLFAMLQSTSTYQQQRTKIKIKIDKYFYQFHLPIFGLVWEKSHVAVLQWKQKRRFVGWLLLRLECTNSQEVDMERTGCLCQAATAAAATSGGDQTELK